MARMKSAKLRLGKHGDVLYVSLHPRYLHLKLVQPGKAQFEQNIYLPRRKLVILLKWIFSAIRDSPAEGSIYLPDREARYLEQIAEHELALRRQKRSAKKQAEKRARYQRAKERARRRRT